MFEELQDGCHGGYLEYLNRTNKAILNLHVAIDPSSHQVLDQSKILFRRCCMKKLRWLPSWVYTQAILDFHVASSPLFALLGLVLYVPANNFSAMSGRVFLGRTSTKQLIKCLAQRHNTVIPPAVRLELATL